VDSKASQQSTARADPLAELLEDWQSDLRLAVSPRVAEILAHHFVEDLLARFIVRAKPTPRPRRKTKN
jgi:hypothetical protein